MQRALVYEKYKGPLQIKSIPIPKPKDDEIIVRIHYSGICHSDLHGWLGDWAEYCTLPVIGGHEGAGEVVKVGAKVNSWNNGDKAGIRILNNFCFVCEYCKKGQESSCPQVSNHGFVEDGTFQEYVAIRGVDAIRIPEKVDLAIAAPVLCAGSTVYKALKESEVKPGEIVVITGAGGGLGSFGIQYAKAMGMRVLAVDHSNKEEHCRTLGAEWFVDGFNSTNIAENVKELTNGGAHGVINIAANNKLMEQSLQFVRPRGTVVFVGFAQNPNIKVNTLALITSAITIRGSIIGSRQDTDEALNFVACRTVKIPYKLVRLDEVSDVFQQMLDGAITSRCIVDFSL